MFIKRNLNLEPNIFVQLSSSVKFEDVATGRIGTNIVDNSNGLIPIVRTTTVYSKPANQFKQVHRDLISKISNTLPNLNLQFNNGLVEVYNNQYRTMGFHSDQAQDLVPNSYICICSFYSDDSNKNIRKLIVKNKTTNQESTIILSPGSIILFDLETNKNYLHKIILDNQPNQIDTKWLGITLRLSKTFIKFVNEIPYFSNKQVELKIANEQEKKDFYLLRSQENKSIDFVYSELYFTISPSDLMNPNS